MKVLPNGLRVFNATPHVVRFWSAEWPEPVEVESDQVISAGVQEVCVGGVGYQNVYDDFKAIGREPIASLVTTEFIPTEEGRNILASIECDNRTVVVGSIIAAQAYPGEVVAMTPAPGYERVPPAEKRMNPHKFVVYRKGKT